VEYVSTRGGSPVVDFRVALLGGLAPDGGLYVPTVVPSLPDGWSDWSYGEAVSGSLTLFGAEDTSDLVADAASRFDHPDIAPIIEVADRLVLELFWGPTLSFKDHALQVLARLLARETSKGTVLGATSGDTGAAAIEACKGLMRIVMLYPEGRVSELQRRQMTTVTDPGVTVVAVRGTFDDCQRMVKEMFASTPGLLAVNSINWARIAAQVGYYLYAAGRIGQPFDVVVPTGNFGNAYSCWMAKQMGAPIESIVLANNANHNLADLVATGVGADAGVVTTLAPAMDIQVPSNLERVRSDPSTEFTAGWADDQAITDTIRSIDADHGYLLDPHTATAWHVGALHRSALPQLVVATAHPAKFPDVIEKSTGRRPNHPRLEAVISAPERQVVIEPNGAALRGLL
jgi:threonine synthase